MQDAAVAVTVVDPDALGQRGLGGLSDVALTAPSIAVTENAPGLNRIDMRGLTNGGFPLFDMVNPQDRPLVAVYLDDTPMSLQGSNPDLRVFDLERIEVIRGPQGTLFGAGSMSGSLRYITAKPSTSEFFGSFEGVQSFTRQGGDNTNVRGILNAPLGEEFAVRIGGYAGHDSGFIDNVGLGRDDANETDVTQLRTAARWTPADRFTLDASVTYSNLENDGQYAGYTGFGERKFSSTIPEKYEDELFIYNLSGEYRSQPFSIISSTSLLDRSNYSVDSTLEWFYAEAFYDGERRPSPSIVDNELTDFIQEVRLVSARSDVFNWTAGVFYQDADRDWLQDYTSTGFDAAAGINSPDFLTEVDHPFTGTMDIRERQLAGFGEGTLTMGRFDITAGVRYFDWEQDFAVEFRGLFGALDVGLPTATSGTADETGLNPRVVLAYRPTDDLMLYAEAAKGFRYGGVNQPVPDLYCSEDLADIGLTAAPATYGADELWSYTIGEKAQFFDQRFVFNTAAFLIDWKDVQTTFFLPCGYGYTQNAGKVRSVGLELDARLRVTERLTFALAGSLTEAEANGEITNIGAADGDRAPYFPRYTTALSAEYRVPLPDAHLALTTDFQLRGNSYTEYSRASPSIREIPSTQVLNVSVTYARDTWELGLFATNLTDDERISGVYPLFRAPEVRGDWIFYGRPRTIGARFKMMW